MAHRVAHYVRVSNTGMINSRIRCLWVDQNIYGQFNNNYGRMYYP
jgi:hypothetical protein